jgi:microcystin-dependent protein
VMAADAITFSGNGLPHDNIQPYLCVRYIISMAGIFPPRS